MADPTSPLPSTFTKPTYGVQATLKEYPSAIITDLEISQEPQTEPIRDQLGAIIEMHTYDTHYTASVTLLIDSSAKAPTEGQTLALEDKNWFVTSTRVTNSNQALKRMVITCERWTNYPSANS